MSGPSPPGALPYPARNGRSRPKCRTVSIPTVNRATSWARPTRTRDAWVLKAHNAYAGRGVLPGWHLTPRSSLTRTRRSTTVTGRASSLGCADADLVLREHQVIWRATPRLVSAVCQRVAQRPQLPHTAVLRPVHHRHTWFASRPVLGAPGGQQQIRHALIRHSDGCTPPHITRASEHRSVSTPTEADRANATIPSPELRVRCLVTGMGPRRAAHDRSSADTGRR